VDIYMKMFSAGGGWGMGVKDFALIFVFHTQDAMDQFQEEGWDFSGQADAGAQSGDKGMGTEAAVTVIPGTTIYQLTEAGLALQATLKGTKFWKDEELN
jgi:lipid-binding SYLF domain-containing protein